MAGGGVAFEEDYEGVCLNSDTYLKVMGYRKNINQRLEPATQCKTKTLNQTGKIRLDFKKTRKVGIGSSFQKYAHKNIC